LVANEPETNRADAPVLTPASMVIRSRVPPVAVAERLLLGALRERDTAQTAARLAEIARHVARIVGELSASLDERAILEIMRHVTLPRPGTHCLVELIEPDGSQRRSPSTESASPVALSDAGRGLQLAVPFTVPAAVITIDDDAHGDMIFVRHADSPEFSGDEIAMAVEITAHCAMALGHARLYARAVASRITADEANRLKSSFLASMSHELRTPLNAIAGFVELIDMGLHGPVTDLQHDSLRRIRTNQQHLLVLITEILDFARIDGGRARCREADVPMANVIADVQQMLSAMAGAKGLTLDVPHVDPDVAAWADADRVRQILMNLVMNAVKYSPPNAGPVSITSVATDDTVLTVVEDRGQGIPADQLTSIFEPFVQLNSGRLDRRGGVGLGLAISRDLARAMNGSLEVDSTVGRGTRFTLSLPRARSAPRAETGAAR
jgi:signal transduction histidine kinase